MRTRVLPAILFASLLALATSTPADASVTVGVSFFHETLTPYGSWVVTGSYGSVWVPSVAAGWEPYVNGEWVYTDLGWSWVSYDSFGDIPFHYGTWVWVRPHGWVWVPGTVWAPAWVTWAYTPDYIGWACVPPSFVLSVSGYFGQPIVVSQARYVFVPTQQFVGVRVSGVRVAATQNAVIFPRATKVTSFAVSNGVVRNVGPTPARLEKTAGLRIERVSASQAKLHPTTLAESGITRTSRLAVVAPARERARAAQEAPSTRPETRKAAVANKTEHPTHSTVAEKNPKQPPAKSSAAPAEPSKHAVAANEFRSRKESAAPPKQAQKARKPEPSVKAEPHEQQVAKRPPAASETQAKHSKPRQAEKPKSASAEPPQAVAQKAHAPKSQVEKPRPAQPEQERQAALRAPQRPPAEVKREKPAPKQPAKAAPHKPEKDEKPNQPGPGRG